VVLETINYKHLCVIKSKSCSRWIGILGTSLFKWDCLCMPFVKFL